MASDCHDVPAAYLAISANSVIVTVAAFAGDIATRPLFLSTKILFITN